WAVSRDETAHGLEPRRRRHEPTTVALQPSEPVSPTDPVAEVIASGGTDNPDGQNQGKPQGPSPHQVAGQEENCFLWDWDTDVADHYEQKDRSVAPVADQLGEIGHRSPVSLDFWRAAHVTLTALRSRLSRCPDTRHHHRSLWVQSLSNYWV